MEPPHFTSLRHYAKHLTDTDLWRPYVALALARHDLHAITLRPGLPGTNPTFIADETWVVKLFTHFCSGERSYAVERETYSLLTLEPDLLTPKKLAHGDLFPGNFPNDFPGDVWPWPYLILAALPGNSLGEDRARVSRTDLEHLTRTLAGILRRLHGLRVHHSPHFGNTWTPFKMFLETQQRTCALRQQRWGSLPDGLIAQLEDYLLPIDALLEDTPPSFLHGDLNEDHVLGRFENGVWHPTGLIDFGDARVGDRLYDLAVLHLGLFRGDRSLLHIFLEGYSDPPLTRNFAHRAMCMTLLHEYDLLGPIFFLRPELREVESLRGLEALLWGTNSAV